VKQDIEGEEALTLEETECKPANPKKGLAAWLDKLSRQTAPLMDDDRTSRELMDELYDEDTGMPK
jgi:hypothetical protein